ncbi:LysR substrate-binding domain-containing protein [Rhizobium sp. Leaf383]|uniref:LysR substrate-binding domain-containing protein n=1 Tax=Rhizobium sp. Leaf383 TaxID=1736357 RepID=UPI001FCDC46D|nr:LysR substrate-binding domain-containing protein [Rhizobium sp. Leaf383]
MAMMRLLAREGVGLAVLPPIVVKGELEMGEVDDMAMMRLLAREGVGLAVLPPIVVKGELEMGSLVAFDALPGMIESFYAVTVKRRFPNPLITPLLDAARLPGGGSNETP